MNGEGCLIGSMNRQEFEHIVRGCDFLEEIVGRRKAGDLGLSAG